MTQLQFFKIGFIVLIVVNIALVTFLMIGGPGGNRPPHPDKGAASFRNEVGAILDLTKEQQAQFNDLATEHRQQMTDIEAEEKEILRSYFDGLINPEGLEDRDKQMATLQELKRQKVELTYNHFEMVKGMLNESQLPKFKDFTSQAIERILVDNKKPPHPPKDFKRPGV